MKLTESQYHAHCNDYDGYCTNCEAVTCWGITEPDAEGYYCEECEQHTVIGMENALLADHIEIGPDE